MPRFVRVLGATFGVLFLILLFILIGFPWDLVAQRVAGSVSQASNLDVRMDRISPFVSFAGPGVQAKGVRVEGQGMPRLDFDRVRVRPAWSLSWLSLEPSIYFDVESPIGRAAGAVTLGETRRFDGWIRDIALDRIPRAFLPEDLTLEGRVSATGDLAVGPNGLPEGDLVVEAVDGLVNQASLPVALKFDTLDAELVFGGDVLARIESLQLVGPMVDAVAKGELGAASDISRSAVDVEAEVTVKAPLLLMMARDMDVPLDQKGAAKFSVGGTLGRPTLR